MGVWHDVAYFWRELTSLAAMILTGKKAEGSRGWNGLFHNSGRRLNDIDMALFACARAGAPTRDAAWLLLSMGWTGFGVRVSRYQSPRLTRSPRFGWRNRRGGSLYRFRGASIPGLMGSVFRPGSKRFGVSEIGRLRRYAEDGTCWAMPAWARRAGGTGRPCLQSRGSVMRIAEGMIGIHII